MRAEKSPQVALSTQPSEAALLLQNVLRSLPIIHTARGAFAVYFKGSRNVPAEAKMRRKDIIKLCLLFPFSVLFLDTSNGEARKLGYSWQITKIFW